MKKKLKYCIIGLLLGLIISGSSVFAADQYTLDLFQVKLFFNGVEKQGSEQPYQYFNGKEFVPTALRYKDTTYVPIRFFSESTGLSVTYEDSTKAIYIANTPSKDEANKVSSMEITNKIIVNQYTLDLFQVKLFINGVEKQGSKQPYQYDNGKELVPTALRYKDTTYVPLRFFSESTGLPVTYEDSTKTIYVGNTLPEDDTSKEPPKENTNKITGKLGPLGGYILSKYKIGDKFAVTIHLFNETSTRDIELDDSYNGIEDETPQVVKVLGNGSLHIYPSFGSGSAPDFTIVTGRVTDKDGDSIRIEDDNTWYDLSEGAVYYKDDDAITKSKIRKNSEITMVVKFGYLVRVVKLN